MNKNDASILIFAQLLNTHFNDPRISEMCRGARIGAVAELAVYCAGTLDAAFMARDEDEAAFKREVRELWHLAMK